MGALMARPRRSKFDTKRKDVEVYDGELDVCGWRVWRVGDEVVRGAESMTDWSKGSKACGIVLVVLTVVLLLSPWWAPRATIVLDPNTIKHESGLAYIAPLPISKRLLFSFPSDTLGQNASRMAMLEDARPLTPGHASHNDIRQNGGGRFSHWDQDVYFSTSDQTDPRSNGRRYTAVVGGKLSGLIVFGILALDLAYIIWMRDALRAAGRRYRVPLATGAAVAVAAIALMAAGGLFGAKDFKGAADFGLVAAVVLHELLAIALTLVHWLLGAGIARLVLPKREASYAQIVLLGFPLGLIGLAVLVSIALAVPFGGAVAAGLAVALGVWPLSRWPLEAARWRDLIRRLPMMMLLSAAFGCWLAFLWHGPTETLPGFPTGDLTFYSSSTWAMAFDASHPLGWANFGNEGEYFPYFNSLIPALGAAVRSILPIDGFLFVLTTTGTMSMLGAALAVHAYVSARPNFVLRSLEGGALLLSVAAAGRYPYWISESPPVAHVVPLTIAVWFWISDSLRGKTTPLVAVVLAFFGAVLSKITSFATLGLLTLGVSAWMVRPQSRARLIALGLLAVASAVYSALMLWWFLPFFLQVTEFSPESYVHLVKYGAGLSAAWPYVARDAGCVVLAVAAFRVVPWPASAAVAFGLASAVLFPFVMRINLACAVVIIGLACVDNPSRLRASAILTYIGLLLCLPAMLLTDPGGESMGVAWFAIVACVILVSASRAAVEPAAVASFEEKLLIRTGSLVIVLALVGLARGVLPYTDHMHSYPLPPEVRDIWKAVRERTPADSLIFTDQVGVEPTLLAGWNTYALHGQRQIYHANWYQSLTLRNHPKKRDERLKINDDVLSSRLAPADVALTRPYRAFYATVSASRVMGPRWERLYGNQAYSLYRWN